MGNFLNALFVTKHRGEQLRAESLFKGSLTLTPRLFSVLHPLRSHVGERLHLSDLENDSCYSFLKGNILFLGVSCWLTC